MPDQRRSDQDRAEAPRCRQDNESHEGKSHSDRQVIRLRPAVRMESHQRLQQRCRQLIGKRDEPYLREIELKGALQQRINRRQQRGQQVIQKVTETDGHQDPQDGLRSAVHGRACACRAHLIPAVEIGIFTLELYPDSNRCR